MPSEGYPMMSGNIGLPLSKDILYTSSTTWAHPFSNREKIYLGLAQLVPFQRLKNQSQLSPFKGLGCAIRCGHTGCIPYYFKKKYFEIILKLIHVI
jgi:hypothetical protein